MAKAMGILTGVTAGSPRKEPGRIRNCGVKAMAAAPKFSPAGDSETATQSKTAPWRLTRQLMTAWPPRRLAHAAFGQTAMRSCGVGLRTQVAGDVVQ
jgi:hypothetical protein